MMFKDRSGQIGRNVFLATPRSLLFILSSLASSHLSLSPFFGSFYLPSFSYYSLVYYHLSSSFSLSFPLPPIFQFLVYLSPFLSSGFITFPSLLSSSSLFPLVCFYYLSLCHSLVIAISPPRLVLSFFFFFFRPPSCTLHYPNSPACVTLRGRKADSQSQSCDSGAAQ